jgi:hypothetical protein
MWILFSHWPWYQSVTSYRSIVAKIFILHIVNNYLLLCFIKYYINNYFT